MVEVAAAFDAYTTKFDDGSTLLVPKHDIVVKSIPR
jgi:hypothetical protein